MNNENKKSISQAVIDKIKKRKVKMKPRMYFILRAVLIALAIVVVVFFVLYLVSFIMFSLQLSGVWFMPAFGFPGVAVLFRSLPWLLIIVALLSIVLLEFFAKHFTFAYRKSALFSLLIIIGVVVISSFAISGTRFHSDLFLKAKQGSLPFAGRFYRYVNTSIPGRDVHQGVISDMTDDGFEIMTAQDEKLRVIVDTNTYFPFKNGIEKDNVVVIFGKKDDMTVRAFGVRKINNEIKVFQKPPFKPFMMK